MYVCFSIYPHVFLYTFASMFCCINKQFYSYLYLYINVKLYTYTHIYMYVYTCVHIYVHIHTHIPLNVLCHICRINVKPVLCCIGVESIHCCTSLRALQEGIHNTHITHVISDVLYIYNIFDILKNYLIYM